MKRIFLTLFFLIGFLVQCQEGESFSVIKIEPRAAAPTNAFWGDGSFYVDLNGDLWIKKSGSWELVAPGDASGITVAATPSNYSAATADVEAHLAGIDTAIGNLVAGGSDGNDFVTGLSLTGTTLTATIPNQANVDVDLAGLQDGTGTDSQTLSLAANTLSITGGNSVSLASYLDDTNDFVSGGSLNAGTQTLTLTVPNQTNPVINVSGMATDGEVSALLSAQDEANEIGVTATPSNYSAATADVEAHLAGIDAALGSAGGPIETTITINGGTFDNVDTTFGSRYYLDVLTGVPAQGAGTIIEVEFVSVFTENYSANAGGLFVQVFYDGTPYYVGNSVGNILASVNISDPLSNSGFSYGSDPGAARSDDSLDPRNTPVMIRVQGPGGGVSSFTGTINIKIKYSVWTP
jgi:hypothetical protein